MSQNSLTDKLAKANSNIKKLCEFFAARRGWAYPPGADTTTAELAAAAEGVRRRLDTMMEACSVFPGDPANPDIDSIGPGTHDNARLKKFTTFLRDLDAWFAAQETVPSDPKAVAAILEMDAHVACMIEIFNKAVAASTAPPMSESAPHETTEAEPAATPTLEPTVVGPDGVPLQLVLDDTDQRPLVQEFQGISELTPECERMADEFLAAWEIELSYYNRKKFLERLLRWISSAPEGQVLVIKMKTLEEPYEPYPSYVSRDVLSGKEPQQDL
jgi:hypothetical protein